MEKPYVDSDANIPEITIKAIILGAILSIVLSAANAYFGLFAGLTVSASIPAAVISMALLKVFKHSNILENNLVQTAASAGESLAAGVIFTIPALVIMGYWKEFNYWETVTIALCGGMLGVLFTIPLRKALIVENHLKFPEGVATAEVLKTGEEGGKAVKFLIWGSLIGGLFKAGDAALNLWSGTWQKAALINQKIYAYFGLNLSPALVAVGYIVGLNISFLVFLGGAISWFIAIPIYIAVNSPQGGVDAVTLGSSIWNSQIRYLGVGAMIVGGLWALLSLSGSLGTAFEAGVAAFKKGSANIKDQVRTELDTPMSWVMIGIGVLIIPIFLIYLSAIANVGITITMTLIMVIAGFLFAAVAGYMAGLVGSSNNPISGVTIATILFASLLLLTLMGTDNELAGAAGAILIGAVVCCAAAIAGDNMQDLKAGHILGATPYKQQIMQVVGVIAGAIAIPLVLNSLLVAYGMGAPTPEQPDSLTAPQATLMQSVSQGIFSGGLPWNMVYIGAGIGVAIIAIDQYLKSKDSDFRMPVLAVAVGLYLPFELDSSIMVGGLLAWVLEKTTKHSQGKEKAANAGLLLASGLITGEALTGILIAIAIAAFGFEKMDGYDFPALYENIGLLILMGILFFIYKQVVKVSRGNL
ncbi:MAG: oligopeptide transporter, OPT family [Ekhidna sp.]|nr:oligopeptide transporter, OPT family [Ekhidna sp.]MBC6426943.1 oligopeptide transporter, OPT family [Ekhidna sp.]